MDATRVYLLMLHCPNCDEHTPHLGHISAQNMNTCRTKVMCLDPTCDYSNIVTYGLQEFQHHVTSGFTLNAVDQ